MLSAELWPIEIIGLILFNDLTPLFLASANSLGWLSVDSSPLVGVETTVRSGPHREYYGLERSLTFQLDRSA